MAEIGDMDESDLMAVWQARAIRATWARAAENGADPEIVAGALADVPEVTAVEALEANRRLADLLTGRRWHVMQGAREAGASWSEIGDALGMTKQGAHDTYRRAIAAQEEHVGDLHDASRARSVL